MAGLVGEAPRKSEGRKGARGSERSEGFLLTVSYGVHAGLKASYCDIQVFLSWKAALSVVGLMACSLRKPACSHDSNYDGTPKP